MNCIKTLIHITLVREKGLSDVKILSKYPYNYVHLMGWCEAFCNYIGILIVINNSDIFLLPNGRVWHDVHLLLLHSVYSGTLGAKFMLLAYRFLTSLVAVMDGPVLRYCRSQVFQSFYWIDEFLHQGIRWDHDKEALPTKGKRTKDVSWIHDNLQTFKKPESTMWFCSKRPLILQWWVNSCSYVHTQREKNGNCFFRLCLLYILNLGEPVHPSVAQGLQRTKIELSLTTVGFTTSFERESTTIWKGSNQNMA